MKSFTGAKEFLPLVEAASKKYGVPVTLILAHMEQESGFKPRAYRAEPQINDGSSGLLQILLKTAKGMDKNATQEKLFDPAYNIDLGVRYMSENFLRAAGDQELAIAMYNGGPAVRRGPDKIIRTKSGKDNVQKYANQVLKRKKEYDAWYKPAAPAPGGVPSAPTAPESLPSVQVTTVDYFWMPAVVIGIGIGLYFYFRKKS